MLGVLLVFLVLLSWSVFATIKYGFSLKGLIVGLVFGVMSTLGMLREAQYYQNMLGIGYIILFGLNGVLLPYSVAMGFRKWSVKHKDEF